MGRPYCGLSIYKRNLKERQKNTKDSRDRTRGTGFELKDGRFRLNRRENFFCDESDKILEQFDQRSCGCTTTMSWRSRKSIKKAGLS